MQKAPTSRKGGQDGDGVNVLIFVLSCVSHVLFVQDHVPEFGFICVEDNGNVLVLISSVTAVTLPMYW